MSTLQTRLSDDLTAAMRARDSLRTDVLRMVKTALTNREIEKRGALTDEDTLRVLQTLVKQREDSAEQYGRGGRADLAERERAEIVVLRAYLPAEASDDDIAAAVEQAVRETAAQGPKDLGKAMKAALAQLKAAGKPADGKRVNEALRRRLGG